MKQLILEHIERNQETIESLKKHILNIEKVIKTCSEAIDNGKKLILFGNGGSASDSQHIAAELVGRFRLERRGLPAISIATDTSALTAISNDYGYEFVFERQIEAIANTGDVLIGISTSGNSENVYRGLSIGSAKGCQLVGFLGGNGGKIKNICDIEITISSNETARIQECHILIGHIICDAIESNLNL